MLNGQIRATGSEEAQDIKSVLAGLTTMASTAPATPTPALPGTSGATHLLGWLDDYERMAALVEAAKGEALYELEVDPARECADGAGPWLEGLATIGRIVGLWDGERAPLFVQDPGRHPIMYVLLQSSADLACVLDWTGVPAARVKLARLPWETDLPAEHGHVGDAPRENVAAGNGVGVPAASVESAATGTTGLGERAASIRVDSVRLDNLMELVGELAIHHSRITRLSSELGTALAMPGSLDAERGQLQDLGAEIDDALQSVTRVKDELQKQTLRLRMVPVRAQFNRFPRIVRDLAHECGKKARLSLEGIETELDKNMSEQIGDPLIHLIRNALDHGLESPEGRVAAGKPAEGTITLAARQQGHHILITVADDGRGIDRARVLAKAREQGLVASGEAVADADVLGLIFLPGFSTAAEVTHLSGRGVGMDVVHRNVQQLGGQILVSSVPGEGTRFTLQLPLTLAINKALLVTIDEHTIAIPITAVEETLRLQASEVRSVGGDTVVAVRGEVLPYFSLGALFDLPEVTRTEGLLRVVVIGVGTQRIALAVDAFVGQQDVVVKPLGDYMGVIPCVSGATILGDGRVALILDVQTLMTRNGLARARPFEEHSLQRTPR
jgi:chemotaxis protein histidine kinase CheA